MRILDRYISKSIASIFVGTLIVFALLFVLIDSASNLDEFIDRKVHYEILFQYYLSYIPFVLVQTASIACLISALLTYSVLNNHNEIIVLRSSGLTFWQITKPALCIGLIVSAIVFYVNEQYIPQSEEKRRQIKNNNLVLEVDRKHHNQAKIKNLTFYGLKNRLYFIDSFDPNEYELEGITIIEYGTDQSVKKKIVALRGTWTGIAWKFFNCHITHFSQSVDTPTKVKIYTEKLVDIKETPTDFLKQRLNVNAMNIRQLYDYIKRFSNSGATRALNNLTVDVHQKIAFPFRNLIILLIGLPLALMTQTRKAPTFTCLGIAIAIGFFYYVTEAVGLALGKGGILPPILSAWLAPIIFSGTAIYLIKKHF